MKKAVIILSGGLDSTTLLYDIISKGYDVFPLSFDYNQRHKKEIEYAKLTCEKLGLEHKIIDISFLNDIAPSTLTRNDWKVPEGHYADENMKQTVVPNRNAIMLMIATSYAIGIKATDLFCGVHAGDHTIYPDCRPEFIKAIQNVAQLCDWNKVNIHAPYLVIDKKNIVEIGKKLKVDYSLTWTCYSGKDLACGKCGSCTERLEAFNKAKMIDPLEYEK
jgi:7-cyano-7-deazaguanine synthase